MLGAETMVDDRGIHGEKRWQKTNIDLGFLTSLLVGTSTVFVAAAWFLAWVDDRIAASVNSYEHRLEYLQERLNDIEQTQREIRRDIMFMRQEPGEDEE